MAHIAIFVSAIATDGTNLELQGEARVSPGSDFIGWTTTVPWTTGSAGVNTAIKDAAIAAAEAAGHTIGLLDNKTLFAGAMGL